MKFQGFQQTMRQLEIVGADVDALHEVWLVRPCSNLSVRVGGETGKSGEKYVAWTEVMKND
jgi:hypothetical protein